VNKTLVFRAGSGRLVLLILLFLLSRVERLSVGVSLGVAHPLGRVVQDPALQSDNTRSLKTPSTHTHTHTKTVNSDLSAVHNVEQHRGDDAADGVGQHEDHHPLPTPQRNLRFTARETEREHRVKIRHSRAPQ